MSKPASPSPEPIPSTMASCSVATRIVESSSRPITAPMVFAAQFVASRPDAIRSSRAKLSHTEVPPGCQRERPLLGGSCRPAVGQGRQRRGEFAPALAPSRRLRGFLFKRGGHSLFIRRQLGEPSALIGETRSIIGIPSIGQPKHDRARAWGPAPQARPNLRGSDLADQVVNLTSQGGELFAQATAYDAKILRFRHNG